MNTRVNIWNHGKQAELAAALIEAGAPEDGLATENGLDANTDVDEAIALHWAAWEAKPRMVRFLLERGADIGRVDRKHGLTPEGWAEHRRKEVGPRWGHDEVLLVLAASGDGYEST